MPHNMPKGNNPVKHHYSGREVALFWLCGNSPGMENVRTIRKQRKLSQVQLAEKAGVTQGTVSKIERGDMNVTLEIIAAIAQALDVEPVQLFTLPDLHRRALAAIADIQDPARREAAILVLESMSGPRP